MQIKIHTALNQSAAPHLFWVLNRDVESEISLDVSDV